MRLALCAAIAFGLAGCVPTSYAPEEAPSSYERAPPEVFTDSPTGCEYLIIKNGYGSALTPRLAGDGLPMCPNVKSRSATNDHP
jgi:hypothetical protein